MPLYAQLSTEALAALKVDLERKQDDIIARGLALNMARGKPAAAQLDLSMPLLKTVEVVEDCVSDNGIDCRNYGVLEGLPEARKLLAIMLDDEPDNVIVLGNASLNAMYDALARCWSFGALGSTPWCQLDAVKWICPVPGYDRHFAVTEAFGIEMLPVPMIDEGPDMDEVERIAASDASVKGIWCVPKYSNPTGITYSDKTVHRLATMECAAADFRIIWDNAYSVHHLFDDVAEQDQVLDIAQACAAAGNPNRPLKFASTSKVTFPGSGIAGLAASPANIADTKKHLSAQTIGYDKLNQLRHVHFLRDAEGIAKHMRAHAAILRPKFALVERKLDEDLSEMGGCSWSRPRGGYFVSFNAPEGTATRIVALAQEAGITITAAGATWPYGHDPYDSNLRIAPSLPPLDELDEAMDVFTTCVKRAYVEKLLG